MGIGVLRVEEDGALSAVAGSPFATGFGILSVVVAPDGRTVYVPHVGDQAVSGYRLDDNGALREIPGARIALDGPPTAAQLTPDGAHLFVVVGGVPGHVVSFAVSPSGALNPTGALPVAVDGVSAVGMASVDPGGRYLRVATYIGNTLSSFAIGPGGTLSPLGPTPVELGPVRPGYTPDGRYLYSSNEFGTDLSGFAVGHDGGLIPTPGITVSDRRGAARRAGHRRRPAPLPAQCRGRIRRRIRRALRRRPDAAAWLTVCRSGGDDARPRGVASRWTPPVSRGCADRARDDNGHSYLIGPDGGLMPSGRPSLDTRVVMSDGPVVAMTP